MANEQVQKALGERFTFTIANTSGATKVVAILAAFFDTLKITSVNDVVTKAFTDAAAIAAAGYACDAVIDDGTIATGVVCTPANSKFSIRAFREYIKNQGRILVDMSVQANNQAAFNGVIEVVKASALSGAAAQYLPLNDFYSVDQSSTSKVNVRNIGLEMNYDTLMLLPIQDGHVITLSFRF